jgi:hypothetical protein
MTPSDDAVILIERAEPAGDFKLRLWFNDATQRMVDFGPFLLDSHNPLIREYLDPAAFSRFQVRDGDLVWGDYDLCFPISDLYDGHV